MKKIQVKTPAKINLTLEILGKRQDGFHEIQSIMQAVSLYDFLTISTGKNQEEKIEINGNSKSIPYNEDNICYRAAKMFLSQSNIKNQKINIYIEKNIPTSAGLAGGSSNAAGALFGLNKMYNNPLSNKQLHSIAASLGSDVNFCLEGGTCITTSRGEKIQRILTPELKILIIKPSNISISAKEAYIKYSELKQKPQKKVFEELKQAIINNKPDKITSLLNNDLEKAVIPIYPEIEKIKQYLLKCGCGNVLMSGSGSSVFGIYEEEIDFNNLSTEWESYKVKTIDYGVIEN